MLSLKKVLALTAALTIIIGIILAIENPFSSSMETGEAKQVVAKPDGETTQGLSPQEIASLQPPGTPAPPGIPDRRRASGPQAAKVEGIAAWVNSDPLTIEQLRGKVVLVDFWTYTCVNCIRTFPYLKQWHARYADDGLVILGIHTPEFNFEEDLNNVVKATRDNGIVWPVALDNDYVTWNNYSNRYWPAKYLVDEDGVVRYTHFGEGAYAETESKIRELLKEAGADLSSDTLALPEDQVVDSAFLKMPDATLTRELYAGYERGVTDLLYGGGGYVQQLDFYKLQDTAVDLRGPDKPAPDRLYFDGLWHSGSESARHARETTNYEDYVGLVYSARSVNAVLTADSGEPYRVRVTMGGSYLTGENKGEDVMIGENGESYLLVTEPRLYKIVENPSYVQGRDLRLSSNSADFGVSAFTFGVYKDGA